MGTNHCVYAHASFDELFMQQILFKHLLCARDCGYYGEQKQLSPCYHGTDSVAEEIAITDVCVSDSASGEVEGVREHRAIASTTQVTRWRALGFQRKKHLEPEKCLDIG